MRRSDLARAALTAAGRLRVTIGRDALDPLCVYDVIVDHFSSAIELRFQALPSLEGMYARSDGGSVVVVSSLRPSGRQRFTAAHELGHHVFGHGTRLDELLGEDRGGSSSADEFIADCFAGYLLMPKLAMLRAFKVRGVEIKNATPRDVFAVASAFGVGYTTLLGHLTRTLRIMPADHAQILARRSPKQIRAEYLGRDPARELHVVDVHWRGRAIDIGVGDYVLLPRGTTLEGGRLQLVERRADGDLYTGAATGIGRAEHPDGWASYVRVARQEYAGRGVYRHEVECDD